jgi:O-antigen/teichoic acid export membrane protein
MLVHPTAIALTLAFGTSYLAVNLIALVATLHALPPKGEASMEAVHFGKKLSFLDIISSISNYLDRILVFTMLGSRETAIYAFAMAPPEQLKGYLKNLYVMALPKIAGRPLTEIKKSFYRKLFVLWGAVGAVILIYILAAPTVYRWLFPAYQESVGYSMIFAVSLLAVAAVLPLAVFNGHQRYRENFNYQVTTSIVA